MAIEQKVELIKLSDIDISKNNVRNYRNISTEQIKELAKNIEEFDQLQPVLLMGSEPKYELIIGQRRYYAIKSLGWNKIKAVFAEKKYTNIEAIIVSLAENMQRAQLTYEDTQNAINKIYDHYKNVKKVADALGISSTTVYNYLNTEKYSTPYVKEQLRRKKITKDDVKRAIAISKGDKRHMDHVIKEMTGMNKYQKDRALNIVRSNPSQSPIRIIEESKKAKITDILTLNLSDEISKGLKSAENKLKEDRETIAVEAIRMWLKDNRFIQ